MLFVDARTYTADRAWGALDLAEIDHATVRLHWTNQPYVWHVNDGPEVFAVLDGAVDMHYREDGEEFVQRLTPGRLCYAGPGDEHVASQPRGADPGRRAQGIYLARVHLVRTPSTSRQAHTVPAEVHARLLPEGFTTTDNYFFLSQDSQEGQRARRELGPVAPSQGRLQPPRLPRRVT